MTAPQLRLLSGDPSVDREQDLLSAVAGAFDPARLTQARRLAGRTKREIACELGISPAAVGQWESGATAPRPDHVRRLAVYLDVPAGFLASGRRYVRLDIGDAHFRSVRSTPASLRAKAIAFTEQVWELAAALETRVDLPPVALPGFSVGEVQPGQFAGDPATAAAEVRRHWSLGEEPVPHLIRVMERHGLIVTLVPFAGADTKKIDAFSTSHLPRPVVALTPDRADDVYRHRYTAAHELGHLVLHGDIAPGDPVQEKEADAFAAEFLTPRAAIVPQLPARLDLHVLQRLGRSWGVSVESLVYRCHEVGMLSDASYRRAFLRLNQQRKLGLFASEPVQGYPGEVPVLLKKAFEVAERQGLTLARLATELRIGLPRLRLLLGQPDTRPKLDLV
ncbi:MAG TPA: XRE family transcriptional regulator [Kineosporiaceae bacterium]|nr:XRE family transcriptional regulator [Kineosporiaceae bacterium]